MYFPTVCYILDVLTLVTSELSDPIIAMIAALIGPQRFVNIVGIEQGRRQGSYLMLCCQVNSIGHLLLAMLERE